MAKQIITNLDSLIDVKVTENVNVIAANAASVTATTKAGAAATSAGVAEQHKIAAANSMISAGTNADNAALSAGTASLSAGVSTTQAGIAITQAGLATTAKNATNALYSAALEVLAQTNKTYDAFDDRWLGGHSSDPIVDNDGFAILDGALYWNTTNKTIKVYSQTSTAWADIKDTNGSLLILNNLADVNNVGTARTNLDVYSKAETSTAIGTEVGTVISSLKGAANGFAELDANKLVLSTQLPSYVDDVIEVATYITLPVTGETGKIYVVIADETSNGDTSSYRWTGTVYAMVSNTLTAADIEALYEGLTNTNKYTDAEQLKLLGIEVGATADQTKVDIDALGIDAATVGGLTVATAVPLGAVFTDTTYTDAEIKTKYENNLDTNAYTDAEQLKLSGIATGATANSTDAVLLARANHTGTQALSTIVNTNTIGTVTDIDTMAKLYNHTGSSGVMHGCNLTNNMDGTISLSAGYGLLRASTDSHGILYSIEIPAQSNVTPLEGTNYISINWNAGTPTFTTSNDVNSFNCLDVCIAYVLVKNGTTLHWVDAREQNVDSNRKSRRLFLQFNRFIKLGNGTKLSDAGTLHVAVTAGKFNFMLEELSHTAFDTSVIGTANANVFELYYRTAGGAYTSNTLQKIVNTTTYDNGSGTLATLDNNKFGVTWFYVILNSPSFLVAVKGQAQYATQAEAEAATPPATVPSIVEGLGTLVGLAVYQKGVTTLTSVLSSYTTTFGTSTSVQHNALAGLQGGTADDYQHLTTTQLGLVNSALQSGSIGVTIQAYNANTTVAGNTFNGVNQLVQLNGTGGLPALNGSLLTGLPSGVTDHTQLTNIGTNTHAQIDIALTRLANTSGTNTGDQTVFDGGSA